MLRRLLSRLFRRRPTRQRIFFFRDWATVAGVVFTFRLTEARLAAMAAAGYPVTMFPDDCHEVIRMLAGEMVWPVALALAADQSPWPAERLEHELRQNAAEVRRAVERAISKHHIGVALKRSRVWLAARLQELHGRE
jgi:hypothetical protein